MSKSIHPDVRKFKSFVKNNPYVLKDVKSGEKTLQDLFEEYMLFGEEDDIWETYKDDPVNNEDSGEGNADKDEDKKGKKTSKDSINVKELLEAVKKMNMNDLQKNLAQISGVLGSVQELLMQFKQSDGRGSSVNSQSSEQQSPFTFRDD